MEPKKIPEVQKQAMAKMEKYNWKFFGWVCAAPGEDPETCRAIYFTKVTRKQTVHAIINSKGERM